MKNLPNQTGDGRRKPNDSEKWSKWSKKTQNSISYYRENVSNVMKRQVISHIVEKMRAKLKQYAKA